MTSAQPIHLLLQPYLQQGLSLWLESGMLRFKAGKELMTPALMHLLKQNKQAIIDWLQQDTNDEQPEPSVQDEFPLASTQGAIWMLYRFAPNSPAYNTTFACTLNGELDEAAVRQAFHALLIRHPMLRTTFDDTDMGPRQRVWSHLPVPLQIVDGSEWSADALDHWLQQEADAPFDLTLQSCLRVKVVRNSVRGNVLIATVHHVGADLWALLIIAQDIKTYYQRAVRGEVLSLTAPAHCYRDHVEWQQEFLHSDAGRAMKRFWQRQLQGAPMQVSFPADRPRPPVLELKTCVHAVTTSQQQYQQIKAACRQAGVTPFVFLQTALQLLTARTTAANDFLIGTPTMGRNQKGMEQIVGDFANPVVLRARLQPAMTVQQLLQQVKTTVLRAMAHQDYPFPAVVQDCNPPRDSSRTPLFQILFVWHQGNADLLAQDDWIGEVLPVSGPRGAPYDIMLAVSDLADHFELNWTYQQSLYAADTIQRWAGEFLQLVEWMLTHPQSSIIDNVPALATRAETSPQLNHAQMQQDLASAGLTAEDVVVIHRRQLVPTADRAELEQFLSGTRTMSKGKAVDLAARPEAYLQGVPLALPADVPAHLFTALCQTAARFPQRGLTLYSDQRQSYHYCYAALVEDARRVAAALRRQDISAGTILLLQMRYDQRFFAVWWGALLAGLRPLNVAMPDHYSQRNGVAQKLYNVAHNYADLVVAAERDRVPPTREWLGDGKAVIDADLLLASTERYEGAPGDDPVAFLQLTSGSTGTPKAIQITHHGILHHIYGSAAHNDYADTDVTLNWLPFDHVVPMLTTHIKDCVLGIEQVQLTTASVLADPLWWLESMAAHRVTHSWAPNFAFQRVVDVLAPLAEPPAWQLHSIRFLMNAGEQVLAPVVCAFQSACAPMGLRANAVQPAFGMAEACTCITYNNQADRLLSVHFNTTPQDNVCDITDAQNASHGFVDLGDIIPGVEIRITNERNEPVKEGVIGRMQIRGPVVTPGYLANPDANAEAFVGDGWFNSGDLGFIWNGRLVLTGREKEMIVVNGANLYCFELEQAATVPGVVPTFVAATGVALTAGSNSDTLVLFYVSDGSIDDVTLERDISARVSETHGVVPAYVIPVEQDDFFKTTSGKIQRNQFRKEFEKGRYQQAVEAWQLRHRKHGDYANTLFTLQWQTARRSQPALMTALKLWVAESCETFADQLTADERLERHVLDWQRWGGQVKHGNRVQSHILLLGQVPDQCSASPAEISDALRAFAAELAHLKQILVSLDHATLPTLTVAVIGQQPSDVLVVQPLLETLRHETGFTRLRGCVIDRTSRHLVFDFSEDAVRQVCWLEHDSARYPALQAVDAATDLPTSIVHKGVYVIVGGLSGLAEPLCQYLVQRHHCRLILLGRVALSESPRHRHQFSRLQSLLGNDAIAYEQIRFTDAQTMHRLLQPSFAAWGVSRIDGVFNLAGQLAMAPLEAMHESHWHALVHPKFDLGVLLVDYLQQFSPNGILVQYGSLNGFFGGQQAGGYSAANALQALLTESANAAGVRTWCLHWSLWHQTGMARHISAAEQQLSRNKGLLSLDKGRDLFWLDLALRLPAGNYYAGIDQNADAMQEWLGAPVHYRDHFDIYVRGDQASRLSAARWIEQPMPRIDDLQVQQHDWKGDWPRTASGHIDQQRLLASAAAVRAGVPAATALERALADIWTQVLDQPVDDVTRTFFEYGGHSINATQLVALVNRNLERTMSVAQLFQYPTIRGLAQHLSAGDTTSAITLPLGLQDFILRADGYRMDCLNPGVQASKALVFLPTASGMPSGYLTLISQLADVPMYVLSMPAVQQPTATLEDVADELVRLIVQSGLSLDQLTLVGWSMGGVIGYEMLRQLQSRKAQLPSLLMLDSGFAQGLHPVTYEASFQQLMFAVELGLDQENFATFNQYQSESEKLLWLQQYLAKNAIEVAQNNLLQWCRSYCDRLNFLATYQADSSDLTADITLMKADWHSHGQPYLGWGEANRNIKWLSVAADHQGIVRHQDVVTWLRQHCQ
ncbi:MAG: condensation domain-containing protein [Gammaproteobacteria bacterium]